MELTTIIGIIFAIIVIVIGFKIFMKKPVDIPSLDTDLQINPHSQQPIIPRHVRDQLAMVAQEQPTEENPTAFVNEPSVVVDKAEAEKDEEPLLAAKESVVEVMKTTATMLKTEEKTDTELETPVHRMNKVKSAEISEFADESSVLESHLHAQQRIDEESALATAKEFIALNVFPDHRLLSGDTTLKILMKYGLRYGEMSCFHRYNEDGSKLLFSVLQITDDGAAGFDLEALSTEQIKGLAFFLALPHGDVQNAFDTMESTSRLIAREIDGTVYDQNHQEFSPHLREYWRHQAIDYRASE